MPNWSMRDYIDLAWFIASIGGLIVARWWPALDVKARGWLKVVGGEAAVKTLIEEAAALCEQSPSVRRAFVVNELTTLAKNNGLELPTSVANRITEFVFAKVQDKLPSCPKKPDNSQPWEMPKVTGN